MFNFTPPNVTPPSGPQMLPFNPQQGLQAFRPPAPMQMGGGMSAPGMQMPQAQAAPNLGGLQQGGLGLAYAMGQRPPDPNANGNMSGFPVGGGPMGPSGGAMANQGGGFWDFLNWLKPSPLGAPLTAAGGNSGTADGTGAGDSSGSAAP